MSCFGSRSNIPNIRCVESLPGKHDPRFVKNTCSALFSTVLHRDTVGRIISCPGQKGVFSIAPLTSRIRKLEWQVNHWKSTFSRRNRAFPLPPGTKASIWTNYY